MDAGGTIVSLIAAHAARAPLAAALVAPDRPALGYAALEQCIGATAGQLHSAGISGADRVAIVLPNGVEMAASFLAVASAAICAPLNPGWRERDLEFYLSDLRAKAVIVQPHVESPARNVAATLGMRIIELSPTPFESGGMYALPEGVAASVQRLATRPEDVALVLHTSGTTARPKLVPLTQANLVASARHVAATLALTAADRCLNVMPLFHIHGLVAALLASLSAGGSVVCTPGLQPDSFSDWIGRLAPTWYTAVPTMHQAIVAQVRGTKWPAAPHALRLVRSSSAALPPAVLENLESLFGVPVIEAYGMTEAAHQMTSNPLPPGRRKIGTVGIAAGPEVAVMDDGGTLLGAACAGEIVVRGVNVTAGYVDNPEANQAAFTNGWFRTGDQGVMDADGYLRIVGRLKEIINRGGEKIAPREIDEALLLHPAVQQAVAFAVPHPTLGEDVAAAVVLRSGATESETELRAHLFGALADYKVPSRIVIVDDIPKGPTGKLQRIGLAEHLRQQLVMTHVAPRRPLEQQLAAIWAAALQLERVGVTDNFFALGGDSLVAAQILGAIEELVAVELHPAMVFHAPTIEQLAAVLEGDVQQLAAALLTRIQAGDAASHPPLFCVPGHSDNPFALLPVIRHLGPSQTVYTFRYPPSLSADRAAIESSIEAIAERYLQEVLRIQPDGPYYLLGHCMGGKVVFEMARRLRADQRAIGFLGLIETYLPGSIYRAGIHHKLRHHLGQLRQRNLGENAAYFGDLVRTRALRLTRKLRPAWGRPVLAALGGGGYVPRPYAGRLVLFRAGDHLHEFYHEPHMGWGPLAGGGTETHVLSCHPNDVAKEPNAAVLGALLRRYLHIQPESAA